MAYSIASSHFVETVQVMREQYHVILNPASHGGITIDEESELPPLPHPAILRHDPTRGVKEAE